MMDRIATFLMIIGGIGFSVGSYRFVSKPETPCKTYKIQEEGQACEKLTPVNCYFNKKTGQTTCDGEMIEDTCRTIKLCEVEK